MEIEGGARFVARSDVSVGGLVHWKAPFTSGFSGRTLPAGTVLVVENNPTVGASAVYCLPERYAEVESLLVSDEDRESAKYGGYSLVIPLTDLGTAFDRLT